MNRRPDRGDDQGRRVLIVLLVLSLCANAWFLVRRGERSTGPASQAERRSGPGVAGTAGGDGAGVERIVGDRRDLLESVERDWLRRAGFEAPAESLRADLVRHPELIAAKGVVGGTMAFRPDAIYILPGGHVWAIADDGHIESAMLLKYDVKSDTTVTWKVAYRFDEP